MAATSQAQAGSSLPADFRYDCHQDPSIMGMGTELVITPDETSLDGFTATLERTPVVPNPHTSTLTFSDLTQSFNNSEATETYAGKGFNLTVSETAQTNPRIGTYFPATMIYTDSQDNIEKQELFCVEGKTVGFPAVTGSN